MGKRYEFSPGGVQRKIPVRGDVDTLSIDVQRQRISFRDRFELRRGCRSRKQDFATRRLLGAQRFDQDRQIRRRPVHRNGKCMVHRGSVMPEGISVPSHGG